MLPKQLCDLCGEETENCLRSLSAYNTAIYRCEKCVSDQREKRALEIIGREVPEKFKAIDTDQKDLLKQLQGKSVFIYGDVGKGKSVFMASLLKQVVRQGKQVKWISYTAFIMRLQNLFAKSISSETPYDEAEKVARFDGILFIDDLGAEKLTDFVKQITYFILNEREQRMLPTVITSNFSLDEIDEKIDRRISSRICGMCEVINFSRGHDRRKEKKVTKEGK